MDGARRGTTAGGAGTAPGAGAESTPDRFWAATTDIRFRRLDGWFPACACRPSATPLLHASRTIRQAAAA